MADKHNKAEKRKPGVRSFFNGAILTDERVTRQFPFVVFLVVLMMLMITNRYRSEKVIREIELLQNSIDDLRSQSITNSARLMNMSRPSDVVSRVREAGLDLDEPIRPMQTIEVNKLKKNP